MQLLDHISITVPDLASVKSFYIAVMATLGAGVAYDEEEAIGFGERNSVSNDSHSYISVFQSASASADPRRHVCFRAQSQAMVQAFYATALAHGGVDSGAPGFRHYHPGYYAAFVLDPAGNKLEAVFHQIEAKSV